MTTEIMAKMQGKALWYVGPGRAELHEEAVGAPKPGEVQVRALFGAISRGTERLVHAGKVPASEYDRMRAPLMGGTFPFPRMCRRGAPYSRPIWRPRSMRCGMARPARPTALRSWAGDSSAFWSLIYARGDRKS